MRRFRPIRRPLAAARLPRIWMLVPVLALWAPAAPAQQTLVDGTTSYAFLDKSMWDNGDAFVFDYTQFIGIDSDPGFLTVNPDAVSYSVPFVGTYSMDPYFLFDTDFKLGVELGASIDSGSVDGNVDHAVSLVAPDRIEVGQPFALTGAATPLASSGFTTRSPTAGAYVDGILEAYVGGYARFDYVAPGVLADHDYRWGNRGFTDNDTSNAPFYTLANIVEREELIGVNRDASGVVRYFAPNGDLTDGDLLFDSVGKGSSISQGPVSLTAGNIDVVANGSLAGASVVGVGQDTLATMSLDIDEMLLGAPYLGLSIGHDWDIVDYDLGYDVVDLDANLDILLQQSFELSADVLVDLAFSSDVLIDGIGITDHYQGPIDQIPLLTLLQNRTDVVATVLVDAILSNETSLGFLGSLLTTLLEAHANVGWDISGNTGSLGRNVGPVFDETLSIPLGDIGVYDNTFSLGLAPVGSYSFALVPEPGTPLLLAAGLAGLLRFGSRRRAGRPAEGAQGSEG